MQVSQIQETEQREIAIINKYLCRYHKYKILNKERYLNIYVGIIDTDAEQRKIHKAIQFSIYFIIYLGIIDI